MLAHPWLFVKTRALQPVGAHTSQDGAVLRCVGWWIQTIGSSPGSENRWSTLDVTLQRLTGAYQHVGTRTRAEILASRLKYTPLV